MLLWFIAAGGALAGGIALIAVGNLRRRLEHLHQSYWELRYQYTQLRADFARLDPQAPKEVSPPQGPPDVGFVPLSSLKK